MSATDPPFCSDRVQADVLGLRQDVDLRPLVQVLRHPPVRPLLLDQEAPRVGIDRMNATERAAEIAEQLTQAVFGRALLDRFISELAAADPPLLITPESQAVLDAAQRVVDMEMHAEGTREEQGLAFEELVNAVIALASRGDQ